MNYDKLTKEEIRILKEIVDNHDLDNYTIYDDECYLNGYARKCLKKMLEHYEILEEDNNNIRKALKAYEKGRYQEHLENERLKAKINKAIEYIQDRYDGEALTHTFDKCNVKELLEILQGSDKE